VPAAASSPDVRLPADGVLLRDFGYRFGPLDSFSLPRTSVVSAAVDQADNVTLVLSAPSAGDVTAYLRRALPAAGFTLTAGRATGAGTTLTFAVTAGRATRPRGDRCVPVRLRGWGAWPSSSTWTATG
jgi:hypothetical protein